MHASSADIAPRPLPSPPAGTSITGRFHTIVTTAMKCLVYGMHPLGYPAKKSVA